MNKSATSLLFFLLRIVRPIGIVRPTWLRMPTVKGVTLSSSTPAFDNAGGVVRYIFEIIETKRANKFTSAICKAESHSDDIGPSVGGGESRISGEYSD